MRVFSLLNSSIYSQLKPGCATWPGYKPFISQQFVVYPVCHTLPWAICTLVLRWQTGCTPNSYDINGSIVLQQAAKALLVFSQAVCLFHLYCLCRFFVRCFFQVSSLAVAVAQRILIVQWPFIHFYSFSWELLHTWNSGFWLTCTTLYVPLLCVYIIAIRLYQSQFIGSYYNTVVYIHIKIGIHIPTDASVAGV